WFTGASAQAVTTGAYRAVEFIKAHIRLEGVEKASVADSKKVVEICTQYAQKGMFNIFLAVFFATLAFAFYEPYFFIGYLISIALFGLYQAIFMANAGGAWDNAKKIVEVELKAKGTELHAATVVGDTVGDPFKDTSSVAMNPVIKFTTLFGLLAVELAVTLTAESGPFLSRALAAVFFAMSVVFVWRSFSGMRIQSSTPPAAGAPAGRVGVAAVTGDSVGFAIGARLGRRLFTRPKSLLFNPRHIERTRAFYARHGSKTIVIARFVPIIRTFAPVVAGVGQMEYHRFLFYNVAGGVGWVTSMTWAGYLLGRVIPNCVDYVHVSVVVLIVLSV